MGRTVCTGANLGIVWILQPLWDRNLLSHIFVVSIFLLLEDFDLSEQNNNIKGAENVMMLSSNRTQLTKKFEQSVYSLCSSY